MVYNDPIEKQNNPGGLAMHTFTFHAIDTATGELSNKAFLGQAELDEHMAWAEARFNMCQVVRNDGKKVVYVIGGNGQWEVYYREDA